MKLALGAYDGAVEARIAALTTDGAARRIWSRDAALWGDDAERRESVANRLGWLDVASRMRANVAEIDAFVTELRDAGFRNAVLLGMGGSSLAPEVLRLSIAEQSPGSGLLLHVLDTTDPATIAAVTSAIDVATTIFFVSSKSGGTVEPNALFAYFYDLVSKAKGEDAGENFVAITDAGTSMQRVAEEHHFRRIFTNQSDIGGRYSALSYFGLVPAAVAGVDIGCLLDRGIAAEQAARLPDGEALRLGAVLGELALAGRDKCTFVVAPEIASFGLWVEQLMAESTGKEGIGILPVAGEPLGSPDRYGSDRLFVQLRVAGGTKDESDAAIALLADAGFPVTTIDLGDAYDIGREFFRWEFAVAVAGHVLGINPFDEPNVQESKDNTARVLADFEATGTLDTPSIAMSAPPVATTAGGRIAEGGLAYALSELLVDAVDGSYVAITAYLPATPSTDRAFARVRGMVRDARRVATTLGYGPRFLHSTGQLHKGGPPNGVFVQVTADDALYLAVPGKPYSFAELKRAQAIGDLQSLAAHGRPVLRVHLGSDIEAGLAGLCDAFVVALKHDRVAGR